MPQFAAIHYAVRKELDKVRGVREEEQPKVVVSTTATKVQKQSNLMEGVKFSILLLKLAIKKFLRTNTSYLIIIRREKTSPMERFKTVPKTQKP